MRRRWFVLVALIALIVFAGGWALARTSSPEPATTTVGLPTCALGTLPREAADTVAVIHVGGPFPFPRNDGVVFGNREGHLPEQVKGYYHEYTVITPGARNRATRRIITGGGSVTDPLQYFFTADHYDSFCLVTNVGRQ